MKTWKILLAVAAATLFAEQAVAQSDEDAEQRRAEMARSEADVEERMRDAEQRLAEAARQIAELSSERLSQIGEIKPRMFDLSDRPRLGITINSNDDKDPVEGVSVVGVTPGSPAAEAGLRTGDIITAVNDESLSAGSVEEANSKMMDFMAGVELGDKLDVEYLRNGNVGTVEIEPRLIAGTTMFIWPPGSRDFELPRGPDMHVAPGVIEKFRLNAFGWPSHVWADMELVELSEGLGRYFGTDTGLLVVSAPKSDALKLQDGDVIQSIDGREPNSIGHAIRILGSYQAGENIELSIMRDKKRQTLSVEVPDDRSSMLFPAPAAPTAAP